LFEAHKASLSPYINRFLSADTIVPGYANPQNLNRYSYVTNNPLRYIDPTGHRACGPEEGISCETGLSNNPPDHTNIGCGGGLHPCLGSSPNKDRDGNDETGNPLTDIVENMLDDDFQALVDNDCFTQTFGTIDWTNSVCVDAVSFAFQDLATGLSSASASWTAILTILGCAPSSGVGCGAGYLLGVQDHNKRRRSRHGLQC
jgi:hypothetical protein